MLRLKVKVRVILTCYWYDFRVADMGNGIGLNFSVKFRVRVLVKNLNGPKKSRLICVKLIFILL